MKRWFDVRAQAHGPEIVIYDEIGAFGIPKTFVDQLSPATAATTLPNRAVSRKRMVVLSYFWHENGVGTL